MCMFAVIPAKSQPQSEIIDSPFVFRVEMGECAHKPTTRFQTGFKAAGLVGIVTALHGVADCGKFAAASIASVDSGYSSLKLLKVNIAKDLALLVPSSENMESEAGFVAVGCTAPTASESVYVVGYPLGIYGQLPRRLGVGLKPMQTLSSLAPPGSTSSLIQRGSPGLAESVVQVEGSLLPGDSGAPVLNGNCVVGVVNGGLLSGTSGISWVMPWSLDTPWEDASGADFDQLKAQPVSEIFTFAGDETLKLANLSISIDASGPFPLQIPIEKGARTYDLRRFGVPALTNDRIDVRIGDSDSNSVLAKGTINPSNRSLQMQAGADTYQSFEVDLERGFLLLTVTFADGSSTPTATPNGITGFIFTIYVKDKCTNEAIPNARVVGSVRSNTDESITSIDGNTATKGELYIPGLLGDPETQKIIITSIKATGYQDLPADAIFPNLNDVGLSATIPLEPKSGCSNPATVPSATDTYTQTPTPTATNTDTPVPTSTPTPIFVAPEVYVVPNRIPKARLAAFLKISVAKLEQANPGLLDPVEIDTIIVIPPSTNQ